MTKLKLKNDIFLKKAREKYQNLSKKKKEKSDNMVVNITKISKKMKKINWLSIEKDIIKLEKTLYYKYNKLF